MTFYAALAMLKYKSKYKMLKFAQNFIIVSTPTFYISIITHIAISRS